MTKYINDPDVKLESRLVAAVLEPERRAARLMLSEMRGAIRNPELFHQLVL